jgi:glutaredoxin
MDEVWLRLLVVGAVAATALAWARLGRPTAAWRRRASAFPGLDPGVVLFTARSCSTCARARAVLDGMETAYREIEFETDPETFTRLGISKVPAIVEVGTDGKGWLASGVPTEWRLRRWLRGP